MRMQKIGACVTALALSAGCGGTIAPTAEEGNAALGIAQFKVDTSPELTTIVGFDAQQKEVARFELIHGRFIPTAVDWEGDRHEIDGRHLKIDVNGEGFHYEVEGYGDVQLPAMPDGVRNLRQFVLDGHVKPVLDKWMIAWRGMVPQKTLEGETAYSSGAYVTGVPMQAMNCWTTGGACGNITIYNDSVPVCGAAGNSNYVWSVFSSASSYAYWNNQPGWTSSAGETNVSQCCDISQGSPTGKNLLMKSCAFTADDTNCWKTYASGGNCSSTRCTPAGGYTLGFSSSCSLAWGSSQGTDSYVGGTAYIVNYYLDE